MKNGAESLVSTMLASDVDVRFANPGTSGMHFIAALDKVQEPFGPVLPVLRFSDSDDAVTQASRSRFGLVGLVWTGDLAKGAEIAARLETGVAWVNHHLGVSVEYPFDGVKASGVGRANGVPVLQRNLEPPGLRFARR